MTFGDMLGDEALFLVLGLASIAAWFWTFIRVAMMRSTWLKWLALGLCLFPQLTVGLGESVFRAPVLFPAALVITFFTVKRLKPSARTALERTSGG